MKSRNFGKTVTEFVLHEQRQMPGATGVFTELLSELIFAAKIINREISKSGLTDVYGFTGSRNVYGEQVQKLDDYAHHTLINRLVATGLACAIASEEAADLIPVDDYDPRANYIICLDPLDGSSNIDVNVSIGTIFSIRRRTRKGGPVRLDEVLRPGTEQVAAGYILYGSSTMMVYTTGRGVHAFTLFPSIGEFLLSHENVTLGEHGRIYSANEGNYQYWHEPVKKYVDYLKTPSEDGNHPYTSRYIGTLVSDIHRNLMRGGIFMYPADTKDPKKPEGKLRLLFEAAPMAFIIEQAGGAASTGTRRIMDIEPEALHDRVPLFIGNRGDVADLERFVQEGGGEAQAIAN
jgi:fructose-1,6-bisphosphatase I